MEKRLLRKFADGFTLAEILITLGIIGVIAAMTIPTLISNINDTRFRSQFFKSYSLLQQAMKRMEADDIGLETLMTMNTSEDRFYNTLRKYFTNAIDCGYIRRKDKSNGCFDYTGTNQYLALDGSTKVNNTYFDDGQILMPDGSLFLFENPYNDHNILATAMVFIFVDLNGASKPPNKLGYDLFCFQITDDGLKPMGDQGTNYADTNGKKYCNKNYSGSSSGMSCSNKLLKNPQDYYKWLRRKDD